MSLPSKTKQLLVRILPEKDPEYKLGKPTSTFELAETPLPDLKDGQVLVQTIYLSNDPAQRGWIQKGADPKRLYVKPVEEGEIMRVATSVNKVVASKSKKFQRGDLVLGSFGWTEYAVTEEDKLRPVPTQFNVSPSTFVGALGGPGLTAYFGLTEVLNFQAGESIIVSGAAGAVGNVVVQLAKHVFGASKVIAIAGTDEKCEWLKKIGADVALNYKSSTFIKDLNEAANGEITTYFDNVGDWITNAIFPNVKRHGRIAVCGAIASYNDRSKNHLTNWFEVITNRLEIKGFIVIDYLHKAGEATAALGKAVAEGKLTLENAETLVKSSFEDIPVTWSRLFSGDNTGKLVTQIAEL